MSSWQLQRAARPVGCSFLVLLASVVLFQPRATRAAGEEYSKQADDLVLTVDSRWAGCGYGGYYPIRIRVTNRGVESELTFRFAPQGGEALPRVQRSIRVAQNSTAKFTLSVPCVGEGTWGVLNVYRAGRLIRALSETLSLPGTLGGGMPRPALLLISPSQVDAGAFETAVTSIQQGIASSPTYGYGYYTSVSEDHQVVGPESLPHSWIDYSGVDLVAISLKTLGGLSVEQRSAILQWVHCGGTLLVFEVGTPAAQSTELARLLELPQHAAVGREWESADPGVRAAINIVQTDEFGNITMVIEDVEPGSPAPTRTRGESAVFEWPDSADAFSRRDLMMGCVYAFPENPFPGTPSDWAWFLNSVEPHRRSWTGRHGIEARRGSDEFLKFLIPSVKGVPVTAFLLLITLFSIVIGPLNYLWLWKRRQLSLLVITIPVLALTTSCALFAYSAVAHGVSTKSRARTVTLIDQKSNTAVSLSRIALFSGIAPSRGLRFTPETAVYPVWPTGGGFDSGAVDWTERQTLMGWLRSRTRTQFLTVSHRDERGRLQISGPSAGRLHVENGLEWEIEALMVSDDPGNIWYGSRIPAGASAELVPVTSEERTEFAALLNQHAPGPPPTSGNGQNFFDWRFEPYRYSSEEFPVRMETSLLEQQLQTLLRCSQDGGELPPGSYAAVVRQNPGIEYGIERTLPQVSLHVLIGRY